MTDQLARLRAEIEAEIADRRQRVAMEQDSISVLTDVLRRMDRIEAECPAAVPEAPAARAPRRDLQGAVLAAVDDGQRTFDAIRAHAQNRLDAELTQSQIWRTLAALVDRGKLRKTDDGKYYPAGLLSDRAAAE